MEGWGICQLHKLCLHLPHISHHPVIDWPTDTSFECQQTPPKIRRHFPGRTLGNTKVIFKDSEKLFKLVLSISISTSSSEKNYFHPVFSETLTKIRIRLTHIALMLTEISRTVQMLMPSWALHQLQLREKGLVFCNRKTCRHAVAITTAAVQHTCCISTGQFKFWTLAFSNLVWQWPSFQTIRLHV